MAIEIDFGRDLGAVAFPDDVSEEQAQQYVRDNYQAIRKSLIEQRQEELAAETEREEKAKFQLGQYDTVETVLNTLSELPRGALEGLGQTAKAFARTFEAGDPFTETPFEQQQRSATQSPIFKAGQAVQKFGQETYPGLPGVRETVPAQIMGGIGSTVSTLPAAAIAGPAAPLAGAIAYGLQAGESALDEADTTINRRIAEALANRQYDVAADLQDRREQMKYGAFVTTAPIGAVTEGLLGAAPKVVKRFATGEIGGIGARLAERLVPKSAKFQRKFLGVTGAERVRGAVEALATEGVQESAEQLGGNIAAAAVYDPERGWLDGVAQAGFIGAASGGAVGGLVGSRRNANLANAAAESLGGDPANPLPRANATVAGIEDTQQEGEAEITAEDVLKMSQETGVAGQEEVLTSTPTPKAKPAPSAPEVDVVRLDQLRLKADAGTINPEELAELTVMHQKMGIPDPVVGKAPAPEPPPAQAAPVDTETGLTADEQDELDQLITAEDAGLLSEEGAITLAAYRARLGFPAQPTTPTEVVPEPAPVPAPAPAPTPVTPAAQSAKLPKDLAGAKPRYNVSMDAYLPRFDSDFDLAAFIVTQANPSKRDADYLSWAVERSGMTPEEVRKHGLQVRAELKKLAAKTKAGTAQKPAALVVPSVTITMPEVKVTATPAPTPTPAPAPAPAPVPEYTPARINKLFQTLKARATAVGKGLYEIKNLTPGQRAVLRTRFGGLQETDQFLLREKSQVTGNPSDEGFILRDKQEAAVRPTPAPAPAPVAPAPATPTRGYTDADFAAAPSREAAADMAVTQVRTNPSLPPRPPQIFYTLQAVANRAARKPYDPQNLTAELVKQAQDAGLITAAKNPKLTTAGQQSLADGTRQSEERKAAQANLSDALRERAVLAWDAANDPQSAAYKEKIAAAERPAAEPVISEEVELNELRIAKQQRGRLSRLNEERLQELEKKLAPAPVEPVTAEPTEAELQAAEEARLAQAEEEIDAGPIGQAKQKLEDEGSDMTKRQVKAMARKLEASGVIDDSELDDEGRDTEVDELVGQLLERVEEARDTAIQEREQELAEEAKAEKAAPKSTAQSAIDAIDKINKGLSENQYSDPLFLTPLAKLVLQIAKSLIKAGIAVDQAIRQAIAQAREQLPNDPTDDIQLADRLIRDAEYMAAVASGDMAVAQRMVDEAAYAAGFRNEGYHGTSRDFTVFDRLTAAKDRVGLKLDTVGSWFTDNAATAKKLYGPKVVRAFLSLQNPLRFDGVGGLEAFRSEVKDAHGSVDAFRKWAKSQGYDGVEISGDFVDRELQTIRIALDPSQIKSADPITRDDQGNVIPLSRRFQSSTADIRGTQPDTVEAALQKVIAATDPRGKAFEAVAALSNFVVFQASKIALRIYQSTKSWVAARNAGMDYIKSHVQLQNEPETAANFEEHIKAFPNQEIPAGTPERPQPPSPDVRVPSRGLFLGDISQDTDENWASEARKWVDFFKGNLERAYQVVVTADIDNAFKEYILGEIIQRNQLDIARAKNEVEVLRALNLEKRLAESAKSLGAVTAKAMAARKLAQERFWWAQPAMILRNLIRKRQDELIPFSKIESEQVRKWLTESGREAVNQIREAMKKADNVFAREFRKIKQVPGEPDGPPIEIKWQDILTQALDTQGSVRQKMLQVILADPRLRNLSPAGIAEITNLLTKAWETKRNQIFRAEFQKKVPLPNVKPDLREKLFRSIPRILKYANIARATPGSFSIQDGPDTFLLWEQAFRDAVAPEFGVAELNGATARKITDLAQKAQAQSGVNRNEIIQQMFRLMAREGGVRFSDALRDYWYAAVLSGVRTQVDNWANVWNGFLNTAMFAGMAKKDAGFVAYSALKGLDEGIRDFWPMLWRGELYRSVNFNPDQPGSALEGLGQSRNLFAKGISQFKYVGRLINALDHMTALMSDSTAKAYALRKLYGPEVARQYLTPSPEVVAAARVRAIAEGTRPELVNKRTREIIQEKLPVEILLTSKEIREMTTFTETPQGLLGSLYRGLDQAAQGKTLYKVLSGTNFLRFAANSANEILNFAFPVAFIRYYQSAPGRSEGEYGLKFSESRRDLLLAKAAFGTALGIYAGALFLGDDDKEEDRNIDITGSFKSLDPNKRKQLLAEGRQPYSIRFGNTYVSYRQLGFGGVLATIGELRDRQLFSPDKWSEENIIEKILDGAAAGMFIVKDSTAISGLTELLGFANAYKYDTDEFIEKSFPRYVSRLAGSLVPNILKEVDAWSDPSIFKTEAGNLGYEYFLQQVPFGRREIGPGPILNVLGEPVKVERYPWSRWAKEREDDLAWGTLGKLASRGVFMPTPAITVKVNENGTRREMTREEKYQYQQAVGQGYRKFIEQNSKRLLALPPAEAADFIDKNADRIRRNARTNLKNSF
jgi:hypothetical protein